MSSDVHIYLASVTWSAEQTQDELLALPPEDRLQAERYRHALRLRSFVASRRLVRHALDELENKHADWRLSRINQRLTPDPQQTSWQISLSHTQDWVACIFSTSAYCGIDIEQRQHNPQFMAIARRFFHPTEYQWLQSTAPDGQFDLFVDLWTRKEACVKAWHRGLAHHLASVRFDDSALAPVDCPEDCRNTRLTVQTWSTPLWQLSAAVNLPAPVWRRHELAL
jgi:4'-phosphopantetheinyl transferase